MSGAELGAWSLSFFSMCLLELERQAGARTGSGGRAVQSVHCRDVAALQFWSGPRKDARDMSLCMLTVSHACHSRDLRLRSDTGPLAYLTRPPKYQLPETPETPETMERRASPARRARLCGWNAPVDGHGMRRLSWCVPWLFANNGRCGGFRSLAGRTQQDDCDKWLLPLARGPRARKRRR